MRVEQAHETEEASSQGSLFFDEFERDLSCEKDRIARGSIPAYLWRFNAQRMSIFVARLVKPVEVVSYRASWGAAVDETCSLCEDERDVP